MISQSHEVLRNEIFQSMKICSQTYVHGCPLENISHTQKLMLALSEFYRNPPSEQKLITRDNCSENELQVVMEFVNMRMLPFSMDSICLTKQGHHLRNMAKGFSALRIEIMPQFGIGNTNFQSSHFYFLHKICQFEEVIREELFRRSHLIGFNENGDKLNADQECCDCNAKGALSWKRAFNGELKCNWCFLINDRFKVNRELPYRMLSINGVPKKYFNLIAILKEEYSLTD